MAARAAWRRRLGGETVYTIFVWLLALTGALGLAIAWRAIRHPIEIPQLPLIAAAMWLYFYGAMALSAVRDLHRFLPDWTLAVGQAAALLSLAGLVAGWVTALRYPKIDPRASSRRPAYDTQRLWIMGAILILIGSVVHYAFINQDEIDWQGTSAYWYLLFHIIYPGIALCVVGRVKGQFRHPMETLAFLALVVFAMFPHMVTARRGPLFPMVMVVVFLPAILRRTKPSRLVLFGSLGAAGLVMLLFIAVRPWVYSGGGKVKSVTASSWVEAVESLSLDEIVMERSRRLGDNEYAYHCGMVATNVELEFYQYGTGYVTLLTHWIPRNWWPGKPGLGEGWYGSVLDRIPVVMGWKMTTGASAGGVAEVFNQFGWLSPAFWFLLAWCAGKVYRRATVEDDPRWAVAYAGVLCASHWLISQGFAAAFVPGVIYQVVPAGAFLFARKRGVPFLGTRAMSGAT